MIRIDFSQLHQAREDAAAAMPSIAGKKILMGFWHNWPAGAADGYQQGSFANIALDDVPSEYNVVAVAFMKGRGIPTFQPYNLSDAEFRRQVGVLNAQGRAVLISLGGADAHIELHAGQEQALAAEIVRLVETYGFDGLDIDLEQSAIDLADNQRVLPAALKLVREHSPGRASTSSSAWPRSFPICTRTASTCLICRPWKASTTSSRRSTTTRAATACGSRRRTAARAPGSRRTTTR